VHSCHCDSKTVYPAVAASAAAGMAASTVYSVEAEEDSKGIHVEAEKKQKWKQKQKPKWIILCCHYGDKAGTR
jgi:hypothetical protein